MADWFAQFGGKADKEDTSDWFAQFGGKADKHPEREKSFDWGNAIKESAQEALKSTAQIPRNIAAGIGDVADLPIMAANYGLRKAGINKEIPYPGNAVAKGIDYITGGYTTPETPEQQRQETGIRAITSTATPGGLGQKLAAKGIPYLSKFGKGVAKINPIDPASLAGTGAGALAAHAYNEANPYEGDLEGIAGTLGSGLAADIGTRAALGALNPRSIANALKINPKNVEAFHNMGVSPTLGQASDNPLVKVSENAIRELSPTSGLRKAINQQYEQMKDIVGPAAKMHAPTEQQTGSAIQSSLKEYGRTISKRTEKLKDKWQNKIKKAPTDLIDVGDTLNSYKEEASKLGSSVTQELFGETPIGKAYEKLAKTAAERGGKATVGDVEFFRTSILDTIGQLDPKSNEKRLLQKFRNVLTKDMQSYMEDVGALKDWNKYNTFYSKYAKTHLPHLKTSEKIPEDYATRLFTKVHSGLGGKIDVPMLNTIYTSQKPAAQRETLNALIQQMGKNGDIFDLHKFATNFRKQSPEAKTLALKPLTKDMRRKFESIIDSVGVIKELNTFGNPSRTGYMHAALKAVPLLTLGTYHGVTGADINKAEVGALVSLAALSGGSKLFSNPKFINWAYKGSKIKNPKAMEYHIKGLKGVIGRPLYQEFIHTLQQAHNKHME